MSIIYLSWLWSSIFFSISAIFVSYSASLTESLVSIVSISLDFLTNSSYSVFFRTSIFTTALSLLKLTRVISNLSICNLSTLLSKQLKPLNTFFNLSISYLSTSAFKLVKSDFLANFDVSTPFPFSKCAFITQLDDSNSSFTFPLKGFGLGKYSFVYVFLSIQILNESL